MWRRLTLWLNASKSKVTKKSVYDIYAARGMTPPLDKIPIDQSDLPQIVLDAVEVFNSLGDRLVAEIGYIGKEYGSLSQVLEMRDIKKSELLLDIILWLDNHCIKENAERSKKDSGKAPDGSWQEQ